MFRPTGFGFSGNDRARTTVREIASLLAPIGASDVGPSGYGVDIAPIVEAADFPSMSLQVQGDRYFLHHHTPATRSTASTPKRWRSRRRGGGDGLRVADLSERFGE